MTICVSLVVVYLIIGLICVLRHFAADLLSRPHYTYAPMSKSKRVYYILLTVLLWPKIEIRRKREADWGDCVHETLMKFREEERSRIERMRHEEGLEPLVEDELEEELRENWKMFSDLCGGDVYMMRDVFEVVIKLTPSQREDLLGRNRR